MPAHKDYKSSHNTHPKRGVQVLHGQQSPTRWTGRMKALRAKLKVSELRKRMLAVETTKETSRKKKLRPGTVRTIEGKRYVYIGGKWIPTDSI